MKIQRAFLISAIVLIHAVPAGASEFVLQSRDIAEGEKLSQTFVFEGFGCQGENTSPQLSWKGAPKGTKSFAISAYDPDAPTGSGWWHWYVINIPANVTSVPRGAKAGKALPKSVLQSRNDYGARGFGGACPPPGEVHRYIFTVHALKVDKLNVPKDASNALIGFMTRENALDSASITAIYFR